MNVVLEKMLLNESLDDKDRYEIRQIFDFVCDEKKQNILKNFDKMVLAIVKVKQDLIQEQEIILWRAISNIEKALKYAKTSWIKNATSRDIWNLKYTI